MIARRGAETGEREVRGAEEGVQLTEVKDTMVGGMILSRGERLKVGQSSFSNELGGDRVG